MRPRPGSTAMLAVVLLVVLLVGAAAIRAAAQPVVSQPPADADRPIDEEPVLPRAEPAEVRPAATGPSLLAIGAVVLVGLIAQGAVVVFLLRLQASQAADQMGDQLSELAATAEKLQLLMNQADESLRFLSAKVAEAVAKGLHDAWPDLGGHQLSLVAADVKARGEVAEANAVVVRSGLDACREAAGQAAERAAEAAAAVAGVRADLDQTAGRARELLQAIAATTEAVDRRLDSLADSCVRDPWTPSRPELLDSLRLPGAAPVDPREALELADDAVHVMRDEGLPLAADWMQTHGSAPLSDFAAFLGRPAEELAGLASEVDNPRGAALARFAATLSAGTGVAPAPSGLVPPSLPDRYRGFRLLMEGLTSLRSRCTTYLREREGYAGIGCQGERLDPSRHEVAGGRPTPSVSLHDTVAEVVRPGLMKGQQVVFPARVVAFYDQSIPNPYA